MRQPALLLASVAVSLAACAQPHTASAPQAKLFLPAGGDRTDVVVLVPGGGWRTADPAGLEPLARGLARAGYVTATISYRAAAVGAHFPAQPADVLCGAASAVAQAVAAGRAGGQLILIGHSAGGQLAVLVALRPEAFRSDCDDPPVTPDAVAALAGAFDLTGVAGGLFGVPERERPDLWHEGDVFAWVRNRPKLPVLLVHGYADQVVPLTTTTRLAADLGVAGHHVRTELLPAATHDTVYRPEVVLKVLVDWLSARAATQPTPAR